MQRTFIQEQQQHINPHNNHDNNLEGSDVQMMDAEPITDPMGHVNYQHHHVSLEEVEDDGEGGQDMRGDLVIEEYSGAGTALEKGEAPLQTEHQMQEEAGQDPWQPFASLDEWGFANWIMKKGISQQSINELMSLPFVSLV
ncbi:hypothetical protein FRB95_002442 [Tulasnella sp. JGI-2019a]|nr:hypothetical protein FRB95_002442 [Tulasnella sp. JGI-2019a]